MANGDSRENIIRIEDPTGKLTMKDLPSTSFAGVHGEGSWSIQVATAETGVLTATVSHISFPEAESSPLHYIDFTCSLPGQSQAFVAELVTPDTPTRFDRGRPISAPVGSYILREYFFGVGLDTALRIPSPVRIVTEEDLATRYIPTDEKGHYLIKTS